MFQAEEMAKKAAKAQYMLQVDLSRLNSFSTNFRFTKQNVVNIRKRAEDSSVW